MTFTAEDITARQEKMAIRIHKAKMAEIDMSQSRPYWKRKSPIEV